MRERGYPVDDFEVRAGFVSVDHPHVVHEYRAAHGISMANDNGRASTEDLREAMLHYRSLFDELLEPGQAEEPSAIDTPAEPSTAGPSGGDQDEDRDDRDRIERAG